MGRKAGQTHIQELKIQQKEEWDQRGGKPPKVLQWKDLPKQVKKKTKKKTA